VLGQPNLNVTVDREPPPATRSTSPTCRMPSRPRWAATPSRRYSRGGALRPGAALSSAVPQTEKQSRTFACSRPPASAYRWRSSARSKNAMALPKSIAKATSAYVAIKYSVRGRDLGQHGRGGDQEGQRTGQAAAGYTSTGRANTRARSAPSAAAHRSHHHPLIFIILYTMFKSFKWALLILANVAMAPIGGLLALLVYGHQFQRFLGRRLPGPFRRVRADRRHHARVHQPAARPRLCGGRRRRRRRRAEAAPDHDDHAGGHFGIAARGHVPRHRSDSQRPFAIVIVGGLIADLVMSIFLLPTLYVWRARRLV
jgi:hypothetical protein